MKDNNNNAITIDDLSDDILDSNNLSTKKEKTEESFTDEDLIDSLSDEVFETDFSARTREINPRRDDRRINYENFDFNIKIGADNEELRAQSQSMGQIIGGSLAQTGAMAVGGIIEGFGYMAQGFTDTQERLTGDSMQFDNLLIRAGKGIQEWTEDAAPVYQTRRAQEGGIRGMGDATWWGSRFPTVASSLAMMVPTFALTRGLGAVGRALATGYKASKKAQRAGKAIGGTTFAQRISEPINKIQQSRKAKGILDTTGSSIISRHLYSSLESSDVYDQVYKSHIQKGFSEEEAKEKAGNAAAHNYRMGWMNIWKDALQWRIILGHRASAASSTNRSWLQGIDDSTRIGRAVNKLKNSYGVRVPRKALEKAGITMKDLGKMGLAEGFEEINIQFQKSLAMDNVDMTTGYRSGTPKDTSGWINTIKSMGEGYRDGFTDFVFDEDTIISDEAFDAAFWAFMSGATTGAGFKALNKTMRGRFNQPNVEDKVQRDAARMEFIKDKAGALQKAQAENDDVAASQIMDDFIFSLSAGGIFEGNTAVPGTLSDGRHNDLIVTLEDIIQSDDQTLEANGISPEMRDTFELLLAESQEIQTIYDHHYDNQNIENEHHQRSVALKKTEAQWKAKRAEELKQDYETELSEIESETTDDIGVDAEYQPIAGLAIERDAIKRNKKRLKQQRKLTKDAPEKYFGAEQTKAEQLRRIDNAIEGYDQRLTQITEELSEFRKRDDIDSESYKAAINYGENQFTKEELVGNIKQLEQDQKHWNDKLKTLNTPEGQQEYIDGIKKSIQDSVDRTATATIEQADSYAELEQVDLTDTSNSVENTYNRKKKLIESRIGEGRRTDKESVEDIDDSIISNAEKDVQRRAFKDNSGELLNKYYNDQIENLDLTDEQKSNLKNYLQDYVDNMRTGDRIEQARQNVVSQKPNLVKKTNESFVNELQELELDNAIQKIQESSYSDQTKKQLRDFVVENEASKRNLLSSKQIRNLAVTKAEKEVREGRKKPQKPKSEVVGTIDLDEGTVQESGDTQTEETQQEGETVGTIDLDEGTVQTQDQDAETTQEDSTETTSEVTGTETFSILTSDGKLSKSEGKDIFKLHKTSETEGTIEIIEDSDYVGLALNHVDGFIRPLFRELNDDTQSGEVFNVSPARVKKVGDKWEIVEKGEVSYGTRMESQKDEGQESVEDSHVVDESPPWQEDESETEDTTDQDVQETDTQEDTQETETTEDTRPQETEVESPTFETQPTVRALKPYQGTRKFKAIKDKDGNINLQTTKSIYVDSNKEVNFDGLANPEIVDGAEINLVIRPDTDWAQKSPNNRKPERVPIYIEHKGQYVGILRGTDWLLDNADNAQEEAQAREETKQRLEIATALAEGQQVTGTVTNKIVNTDNIYNIHDKSGPVMLPVQRALRDQFTINEEGNIELKRLEPGEFLLTTSEHIESEYSEESPKLTFPDVGYDFVDSSLKGKINADIADTPLHPKGVASNKNLEGNVFMVALDPKGNYKGLPLVTRNLDERAVNKIMEYLQDGDINNAKEVVSMNSPEVRMQNPDGSMNQLYLEHFDVEGKNIIRFYSDNAETIVEAELSNLLENNNFRSFREFNDEGKAVFKPFNKKGFNGLNEFKKLLLEGGPEGQGKKFQVDRNQLGDSVGYTSRVTGNDYDNYQDYLMSQDEHSAPSDLSDGILATNVISSKGAIWADIGIDFETEISDPTQKTSETQKTKQEVTEKVSKPEKKLSKRQQAIRQRSRSMSNKIKEAYESDGFFAENDISLEQFTQRFRKAKLNNPSLTLSRFIESQKDDDANQNKC